MFFASNAVNDVEENADITNKYLDSTFKAFVDAIIPRSPELAEIYGRIQFYGALDLHTDEYMIMSLNSLKIPLALPIAEVLNETTERSVNEEEYNIDFLNSDTSPLSMLSLLERQQILNFINIQEGIESFQGQLVTEDEYVNSNIISLNRMAMMGFYSEWSGYGSTRLNSPNQRKLEFHPISWRQINYPGPSFGYRLSRSFNLYIN